MVKAREAGRYWIEQARGGQDGLDTLRIALLWKIALIVAQEGKRFIKSERDE